MTPHLLANHLFNFAAPAAFVALLVVLLSRLAFGFLTTKRAIALSIPVQIAINFIANMLVLMAGLLVFGRDGKVWTYAALVLGAALSQWIVIRGWSRA